MRRKRAHVPAFLELTTNGVQGYVPAEEYLRDPEYRKQAANLALAHLGQWRAHFGNVLELLEHEQGQAFVRHDRPDQTRYRERLA